MEVEEIIESLVNMNHLIELDYEQLAPLEDDEPWDEGWLRFHDTLTGKMVCVNIESPSEEEPIGTIVIAAMTDITIAPDQVSKYISIEKSKSDQLALAKVEPKDTSDIKSLIKTFENMDHILTVDVENTPKGWVSLLDTTTSSVIYINEKNKEYTNEPIGTIVIGAFLNTTIPEEGQEKYINAQLMKSELALSEEAKMKLESSDKMKKLFSGKL